MNKQLLKKMRLQSGLKQKDIAKKLGIAPNSYSDKENGNRKFTIQEAIRICEILECDVKEIFLTS
ncbi:XRE family transcriptional regulator [Paraclostridium bifermentans]|uniref:XRE family transcriptional regulator n=1 Tax=Paraclostridium bifermentans TaxID=1490 RepID=A0A5P3XA39_PARBF|nr:helix-turn-helix transcriptional regulator [Paraclostridium bifermentans]QEZ68026.1 XRE family transcriptional regulator [Paraclostridium bifermentans]